MANDILSIWALDMLKVIGGAATGGAGLQIFQTYMNRKKTSAEAKESFARAKHEEAEAEQVLSDIVEGHLKILLQGFSDQIKWLEKKIGRLEKQVAENDEQMAAQQIEMNVLRVQLAECLARHPVVEAAVH